MKDYYEILQVSPNAELDVIQAAYKRLAFKYHPDRSSEIDANEKMQLLNEAYGILSDPERRCEYNKTRSFGASNASAGSTTNQSESSSNSKETKWYYDQPTAASHGKRQYQGETRSEECISDCPYCGMLKSARFLDSNVIYGICEDCDKKFVIKQATIKQNKIAAINNDAVFNLDKFRRFANWLKTDLYPGNRTFFAHVLILVSLAILVLYLLALLNPASSGGHALKFFYMMVSLGVTAWFVRLADYRRSNVNRTRLESEEKVVLLYDCNCKLHDKYYMMIDVAKTLLTVNCRVLISSNSGFVASTRVRFEETYLAFLKCNIKTYVLHAKGVSIYFFPDCLLIDSKSSVKITKYEKIFLASGVVSIDEGETIRIDTGWLHQRKDGGPDLRYNVNYRTYRTERIPTTYESLLIVYGEFSIRLGFKNGNRAFHSLVEAIRRIEQTRP